NLTIQALSGGKVDLRNTTALTDPTTGDLRFRAINVRADGGSSSINLSSVTSFLDNYGGSTTGAENRSSTLTATNGGTVQIPLLTTLNGVALTLDNTSSLPTAQFTSATSGNLTLSGSASFDFS